MNSKSRLELRNGTILDTLPEAGEPGLGRLAG